MSSIYSIDALREQAFLSELDVHFARFIAKLNGSTFPELLLAAALVSQWRANGHVCLNLASIAGKTLPFEEELEVEGFCPALDDWRKTLTESSVVGVPGDYHPLILDEQNRLYLHRYQFYENSLTTFFRQKINGAELHDLTANVLLKTLYPDDNAIAQRNAVETALRYPFCVITGGPGTGKTTTVVNILAMLVTQAGTEVPRIALAAPTGKAAGRLRESIRRARTSLPVPDNIKAAIPEQAVTVHRLLEMSAAGPLRNADNPLNADVVVVDEASMVDMILMHRLVNALPPRARLILLGDKDQLASVEAGAVLGDLCEIPAAVKKSTLSGHYVVTLDKSFRFGADSGIGQLATLVNDGNTDEAIAYLQENQSSEVIWQRLDDNNEIDNATLETQLSSFVTSGFAPYLQMTHDPMRALQQFEQFRVLCAHRHGVGGVSQLNAMIEQLLTRAKHLTELAPHYVGRPVMVTENDYQLGVFNGEVGLELNDPAPTRKNRLSVFFETPERALKSLVPARLPMHETAFAMTVHKSQGSEFNHVLLVLPPKPSPVLTRSLLYTAITRAKERIVILGTEAVLRHAISTRTQRDSGLNDALWSDSP